MQMNRQWLLRHRPEGLVGESDFEWREVPLTPLGEGEARVRVLWLSFDPAQRGWINDVPGYVPPVQLGEPMRAGAVGQIVESRRSDFAPGDFVQGTMSWQDYVTIPAASGGALDAVYPIRKVDASVPLTQHLGVLGLTGLTAYIGMVDVGQVRAGDTVVVSGAAGATGSVAGQIAKIAGARVIGIAGGPEKCRWLTERGGFDAAIDYRHERVSRRLRQLAPDGVSLCFDNVGGETLDAMLLNLALRARVVVCGGISGGYGTTLPAGPKHYMQLVVRSARMEGFLVLHYRERYEAALAELKGWVAGGRLQVAEDVVAGLERAPATLRRLFEGGNLGKQLLKIADPPLPAR